MVTKLLSTGKIVALERLARACGDAKDVKKSIWQFAVKLQRLLDLGVSESDLRWLIARRFAEQALEVTRPGDRERSFKGVAAPSFANNSCFVISHAGLVFHQRYGVAAGSSAGASAIRWDAACRELRVDGKLAKRFIRVARAQWAVLNAFQASNWQRLAQIECPTNGHRDPTHRLREIVAELNKGLDQSLIRFRMDGSGNGVIYDLP